MICEKCGQREANVRFTEIVNGNVAEHNLCMECAGGMSLGGYGSIFSGESQLGRLLTGLLGFAANQAKREQGLDTSSIICPVCKTSYDDFAENSRFGCPDCYEVFELLMSEHIKTIQGAEQHRGKVPMRYKAMADRNSSITRQEDRKAAPMTSGSALDCESEKETRLSMTGDEASKDRAGEGQAAGDRGGEIQAAENRGGEIQAAGGTAGKDQFVRTQAVNGQAADSSEGLSSSEKTSGSVFSIDKSEKIAILKAQLKEALREEDYDMAAKYRDKIRALQAEVTADE